MSRNPQNLPAPASTVASTLASTVASTAESTQTPSVASPSVAPVVAVAARRDADARGSVLIFVVGVLLLLAIVATAFLGSSRSDRTATQQNSFNTQVDLLLEGVVNAAKSQILNDESIPARMTMSMTSFEKYDAITTSDMPGLTNDNWLASRVPGTADANMPYATAGGTGVAGNASSQNVSEKAQRMFFEMLSAGTGAENPGIWSAISEPVLGNAKFESPYRPTGYNGSLEYDDRKRMLPTFVKFAGQDWPAFAVNTIQPPAAVTQAGIRVFLAGDADGDGIADSGLFRIPVGQLSGITYFGAVRIIDNNAAVNLNTAQSRDYDFAGNGAGRLMTDPALLGLSGAFPSGVGLAELLRTYNSAPVVASAYDSMSTAPTTGDNEFTGLSRYRFNVVSGMPVRPAGVQANATIQYPYDDTKIASGTMGPRNDFQFFTTGEMLGSQIGRRPGNLGKESATAAPYRSAYVDGLALASRFSLAGTTEFDNTAPASSENALARKLYLSLECIPPALPPSTFPIASQYLVRSTPFSPQLNGAYDVGVRAWFLQNFDYLNEDPANPATGMNRRTIVTGLNGVGDQDALTVAQTGWDYLYDPAASQWTGATPPGGTAPLFRRNVLAYDAYTPTMTPSNPTPAQQATLPMSVAAAAGSTTTANVLIDPKVSINTGRFEELFYGYFKTMVRTGYTGLADDLGTPFSTLYTQARLARSAISGGDDNARTGGTPGYYYTDPYIGRRFLYGGIHNPVTGYAPKIEPAGATSVINGGTAVAEQHPLRMFSSSLRAAPLRSATTPGPGVGYWNENTPRLPADQMIVLRAAIAAANLEALRDSSHGNAVGVGMNINANNDRIFEHRIPLTAQGAIVAGVPAGPTPVVARVFGMRRQVFIAEIYANSSADVPPGPPGGGGGGGTGPTTAPGGGGGGPPPNTNGYVAIKLYNPNNVPISLQYCRLVGLKRVNDPAVATTNVAADEQYPNMFVNPLSTLTAGNAATTDQIDLGTAVTSVTGGTLAGYIIPANGTLTLENYDSGGAGAVGDAVHRPGSSGMAATGLLPATPTDVNVAYVPGLHRVVWDRETVLMRPTNCTPPRTGTTPANLLTYTHPTGVAPATMAAMAPIDSFDFTGLQIIDPTARPLQSRAQVWYYSRNTTANSWKWVYPGRYDANQSIPYVTTASRPRQQGTVQAFGQDGAVGFDPMQDMDPWYDATQSTTPATVAAALVAANGTPPIPQFLTSPAATPTDATYQQAGTFTIQLNAKDWPTDDAHKLHSPTSFNLYPYGGFRRLGDMLQAPFIGAYTIQTKTNAAATPVNDIFLEVNPVTVDAAMAEDTDPNDNENFGGTVDNGSQSREQIGRFIPLRPSIGNASGVPRPNGSPAYFALDMTVTPGPSGISQSNDNDFVADQFHYGDQDDRDPIPPSTSYAHRYQWAASLFDHFTVRSPHDDYTPDYPTQPKWQPNINYSGGDTVQYGQNIFVCLAAPGATVMSGNDPSVDPDPGTTAMDTTPYTPPVGTANWAVLPRTPVSNAGAAAGNRSNVSNVASGSPQSRDFYSRDDSNEAGVATAGLINLNTAPEAVLAKLPWVPRTAAGNITDVLRFNFDNFPFNPVPVGSVTAAMPGGAGDGFDDNAQIAHLIVAYRDGNYYNQGGTAVNNVGIGSPPGLGIRDIFGRASEPFKSINDLYKVPGFRAAQDALLLARNTGAGLGVGPADGDYAPMPTTPTPTAPALDTDGVKYDFEEQTLFMNRVSNLVTTRSDVFTLYALVQGWRNVGTDHPELVVQRRAAFIIDRSGVTAQSPTLSSTRVPVN